MVIIFSVPESLLGDSLWVDERDKSRVILFFKKNSLGVFDLKKYFITLKPSKTFGTYFVLGPLCFNSYIM